jgi:hypothetical protein
MRKFTLVSAAALLSIVLVGVMAMSEPPDPRQNPNSLETVEEDGAKTQLDVLKKKLPGIMAAWLKDRSYLDKNYQAKLRVARRTSPTTAKVTFFLEYHDPKQPDARKSDELVSIFLSFCDGAWTATSVKATCDLLGRDQFLMLAIDEAGDK